MLSGRGSAGVGSSRPAAESRGRGPSQPGPWRGCPWLGRDDGPAPEGGLLLEALASMLVPDAVAELLIELAIRRRSALPPPRRTSITFLRCSISASGLWPSGPASRSESAERRLGRIERGRDGRRAGRLSATEWVERSQTEAVTMPAATTARKRAWAPTKAAMRAIEGRVSAPKISEVASEAKKTSPSSPRPKPQRAKKWPRVRARALAPWMRESFSRPDSRSAPSPAAPKKISRRGTTVCSRKAASGVA